MSAHTKPTPVIGQNRWFSPVCLTVFLCTQPSNAGFPESGQIADSSRVVSGVVCDSQGPIAGATVRLQTTPHFAVTDSTGSFELPVPNAEAPLILTAWSQGYYIGGGTMFHTGGRPVEIKLERHCDRDYVDYEWASAFSGIGEQQACQNCHAGRST
jgi:hypothetical protein